MKPYISLAAVILLTNVVCIAADAPATTQEPDAAATTTEAPSSPVVVLPETLPAPSENMMAKKGNPAYINPEAMLDLLPKSIDGLEHALLIKHWAIRSQPYSMSETSYRSEGYIDMPRPKIIDISYTDYGINNPLMKEGLAQATSGYSHVDGPYYDRVTTISGYPAYESFNADEKLGTLDVYVGDRIKVSIGVRDYTDQQTRDIAEALPLKMLEQWAAEHTKMLQAAATQPAATQPATAAAQPPATTQPSATTQPAAQ